MTASLCHPVFDLIGADDFAAFDGVCIDRHQLERFAALRHTYEVARWGLTPDLREPWGGIRYYHCRPSIYQLVP
jgi:hypothetical protein